MEEKKPDDVEEVEEEPEEVEDDQEEPEEEKPLRLSGTWFEL